MVGGRGRAEKVNPVLLKRSDFSLGVDRVGWGGGVVWSGLVFHLILSPIAIPRNRGSGWTLPQGQGGPAAGAG